MYIDRKERLQEIADSCPISKLLQSDIKVRTFILKEGDTKQIKYANEEITVVWKSQFCRHSTRCWTQLPRVFNPRIKKCLRQEQALYR